jgi:hypothetical protein
MKRAFSPVRPKSDASIADRAGRCSPNRSAHTWLNTGRSRCRSRFHEEGEQEDRHHEEGEQEDRHHGDAGHREQAR